MNLEKTTNKERVEFWKSRGFINAKYENGYITESEKQETQSPIKSKKLIRRRDGIVQRYNKSKPKGKWEIYSTFDDLMDAKNSVRYFNEDRVKAKIVNTSTGYAVYQWVEND